MKTALKIAVLLMGVVFGQPSFGQSDEKKAEIRLNVDWAMGEAGDAPPAQMWVWTWTVPVPVSPDASRTVQVFRGPVGAISCGYRAVLFGLAGNQDAALQWLVASQVHNADVVELYRTYPDYTVQYAINAYWKQSLQAFGFDLVWPGINYAKGLVYAALGKHNPGPFPEPPAPVRERSDMDHGNRGKI